MNFVMVDPTSLQLSDMRGEVLHNRQMLEERIAIALETLQNLDIKLHISRNADKISVLGAEEGLTSLAKLGTHIEELEDQVKSLVEVGNIQIYQRNQCHDAFLIYFDVFKIQTAMVNAHVITSSAISFYQSSEIYYFGEVRQLRQRYAIINHKRVSREAATVRCEERRCVMKHLISICDYISNNIDSRLSFALGPVLLKPVICTKFS
jgi:hypothetical protein